MSTITTTRELIEAFSPRFPLMAPRRYGTISAPTVDPGQLRRAGIELGRGTDQTPVRQIELGWSQSQNSRGNEYLAFVPSPQNMEQWLGHTSEEHLLFTVLGQKSRPGCGERLTYGSCGCGYHGGCPGNWTSPKNAVAKFVNRKFAHLPRQKRAENRTGLMLFTAI